ncbi:MAG: radical SAM protein, partial [Nitrospirae bacterium]|nr:radical SAM protein [Nitrospirota bacterium]
MTPSVLYIWLPCKKIYPLGVTYLSLIPPGERRRAIREAVRSFRPELISFTWRDIQIYAPHEGDRSLETAFRFYYGKNPLDRLSAAFAGLRMVWSYQNQIREKLSLIRNTLEAFPDIRVTVGGGAFGVFPEQVIRRLPEGVIGVIGEGEAALLALLRGEDPLRHRTIQRKGKEIIRGTQAVTTPIEEMGIDFPYLEAIFPQVDAY